MKSRAKRIARESTSKLKHQLHQANSDLEKLKKRTADLENNLRKRVDQETTHAREVYDLNQTIKKLRRLLACAEEDRCKGSCHVNMFED